MPAISVPSAGAAAATVGSIDPQLCGSIEPKIQRATSSDARFEQLSKHQDSHQRALFKQSGHDYKKLGSSEGPSDAELDELDRLLGSGGTPILQDLTSRFLSPGNTPFPEGLANRLRGASTDQDRADITAEYTSSAAKDPLKSKAAIYGFFHSRQLWSREKAESFARRMWDAAPEGTRAQIDARLKEHISRTPSRSHSKFEHSPQAHIAAPNAVPPQPAAPDVATRAPNQPHGPARASSSELAALTTEVNHLENQDDLLQLLSHENKTNQQLIKDNQSLMDTHLVLAEGLEAGAIELTNSEQRSTLLTANRPPRMELDKSQTLSDQAPLHLDRSNESRKAPEKTSKGFKSAIQNEPSQAPLGQSEKEQHWLKRPYWLNLRNRIDATVRKVAVTCLKHFSNDNIIRKRTNKPFQ